MNMFLEINDFVLCLGVGKATAAEQGVLHAHLFCLNDPICLMTRRWQPGEEFITGKWYRKSKSSKKYELIGDVVPTMVVQKMDLIGNSQKTILELILPVFFPPDLSALKQYGQVAVLRNRNSLSVPICPLFGSDNVEYLPAVCWDQEQIGMYSDQLYALKINLSYTIGSSLQWTHLNTNQLKPWDYEEYQIVKQLCMESRTEGLLLDGICPLGHNMNNSPNICFMLNKQAELAIAICPPTKQKRCEFREYWPIRLGIYEFQVIIALDCPQSDRHKFNNDLIIRKLSGINMLFEIIYTGRENVLENLTNFPWLGCITDQFHYLDAKKLKDKIFSAIQAIMVFSLEKRSVAWVVVGNKDQQDTFEMGDNLLNGGNEDKSQRQLEEVHGNRKFSSSSSNLSIAASHSSVAPKEVAIAVFMTIRFGGDGDAVFLFWDPKSEKFTRKCYAQFHKSLNFNVEFGKWFELKYLNVPGNELHIIVFDYEEIRPRAVTRVRDNLCAQFSTNRDRFINVWHTTFPCKEKNNYAEDKGWWPWLCRKCFPSLRELSPPTILELKEEQKVKEELTGSLEDLDKRMRHSFALEEEGNAPAIKDKPSFESTPRKEMAKKHQHMPIIQKLSINPQSVAVDRNGLTTVLAVLFTVREECGDAVFLIFNESKRMFTNQIYADKPEKIVGNPLVGHWYWMKYKSNCDIQDGKRINVNVIEVEEIKGNPPVETRVKYDGILAQFNTRQCYIKNWHKKIMHGKFANKESSDAPWWPNICFYCYPNANKNEDVNTAMANSSKWATGANALPVVRSKNWTTKNVDDIFTETSDSEEEMVEMDTVSKDGSGRSQMSTNTNINRSFTPNYTMATVNVRYPPISAVGNISGPVKFQSFNAINNGTSMTNLNGNNSNDGQQQNIQSNSPSATGGLAQNEASKNSDNSQSPKLTGGFGMGQPRRHQRMLANSTLSFARSNSPSTSQMGQK